MKRLSIRVIANVFCEAPPWRGFVQRPKGRSPRNDTRLKMCSCLQYFKSSIGKKQVVATTGLLLILFVTGHLIGNLIMFAGPQAYNHYSHFLVSLRPFLYLIEFGLFLIFVIHIFFTYLVVLENIQARGTSYSIYRAVGERSFATRIMPYTGTFLFLFIIWHIFDFTLSDREGLRAIMSDGANLGLYGVVYNSFRNPLHSLGYILAMGCLGFHLSHGIQSSFQTYGFNHPKYTPLVEKLSNFIGLLFAFGFSSIPVYVMLDAMRYQ